MRYQEIRPTPSLASHIECFWILQDCTPAEPALPERVLPDGCVELIFNFGAPFAVHAPSGVTVQPHFFVVGQMDRPMRIAPTGRVDVLGVRFQPAGAFAFLRLPVHELTGFTVPLTDLLARSESAQLDRLCDAEETAARVQAFEAFFRTRVLDGDCADLVVDASVRELLRSGGCVGVADLADRAGVSRRQLERRFNERVGIGPKLLSRILRFHRVLRAFDARADWAAVAVECGYYDQSHLIHDFRQFSDECPSAVVRWDPLTTGFLRKNRMSHFSKKLEARFD